MHLRPTQAQFENIEYRNERKTGKANRPIEKERCGHRRIKTTKISTQQCGNKLDASSGAEVSELPFTAGLLGAVGEFSSPELILCADSYSVSVPTPCYRSGI